MTGGELYGSRFGTQVEACMDSTKIVSLCEYRKTRRGQAILLKRLIERHLAEAEKTAARNSLDDGMSEKRFCDGGEDWK